MAAQLMTPFCKGRRIKNDHADAVAVATEKATPGQPWVRSLDGRMPFGEVIVAIANKQARQIRAMLAHQVDYDPHACLRHPTHRQTREAHAA